MNIRIADDAVRQDEEHVEQKKPHVHGDVEKQDLDIGPTVTVSITTFPVTSPTPSSDKNTNNHTSQANTYYHSNQTQWQAQQNKVHFNISLDKTYTLFCIIATYPQSYPLRLFSSMFMCTRDMMRPTMYICVACNDIHNMKGIITQLL